MDKLYYIVCEEKGSTLFEGKFQGRTRGAAMKFLKERIGRASLAGVVFTITEIPVPVIREIVESILKGEPVTAPTVSTPVPEVAAEKPAEEKVVRFDAFERQNMHPIEEHNLNGEAAETPPTTDGETNWKEVRKFYRECRSPKKTAERFCVSVNTVKARIRREEW